MSEPKNELEDLPEAERELTPEQADAVGGGASDYLLMIDGIKGESSDKRSTSNTYRGTTTVNQGVLN